MQAAKEAAVEPAGEGGKPDEVMEEAKEEAVAVEEAKAEQPPVKQEAKEGPEAKEEVEEKVEAEVKQEADVNEAAEREDVKPAKEEGAAKLAADGGSQQAKQTRAEWCSPKSVPSLFSRVLYVANLKAVS
jgi:hypothetical protein